VADRGSAVGAERSGRIDRAVAGRAVRGGGCWFGVGVRVGKDLAGDVESLSGVVLPDAARHEEALDKAEDCGDASPEEDEVKNSGSVSAQIEVMNAEVAEAEREKKPDDLVFMGTLVLGIKPGALLLGHAGGVERVGDLHDFVPLGTARRGTLRRARWFHREAAA
jgi:hypothetical protein